MEQKPRSWPNGGDWQTCRSAENTGHYINIMSATYWAGVATAVGKDPRTQSGSSTQYYVENFAEPNAAASMIVRAPRWLGISGSRSSPSKPLANAALERVSKLRAGFAAPPAQQRPAPRAARRRPRDQRVARDQRGTTPLLEARR